MNVLWITEFFPASRRGEITGGVEARCFFVSKYLKRLGLELKIVARRTGGKIWETADTRTIPGRLVFLGKAAFEALSSNFDIVEGSNFITYPLAWLAGMVKRKPVVFWYADVYIGQWQTVAGRVTGAILEIWERGCLLLPGVKFIAISSETKKKLMANGVAGEKIKVINCGVDPEELKGVKIPARKAIDIVCVSRLLDYKRVEDLIMAVAVLKIIRCLVIGRGPEFAKLKKLAIDEGVEDKIQFAGYIPAHQDVLKLIAKAKVFCLPSVVEGFGISTIEAAGLGLPFVVADLPVNREILDGSGAGLFFEPKNYADLAGKLGRVLKDHPMYTKFTHSAQRLARKYNWEKIATQTQGFYEDLSSH